MGDVSKRSSMHKHWSALTWQRHKEHQCEPFKSHLHLKISHISSCASRLPENCCKNGKLIAGNVGFKLSVLRKTYVVEILFVTVHFIFSSKKSIQVGFIIKSQKAFKALWKYEFWTDDPDVLCNFPNTEKWHWQLKGQEGESAGRWKREYMQNKERSDEVILIQENRKRMQNQKKKKKKKRSSPSNGMR